MRVGSMPRHQHNVDGPFYTTGGCLACGAPEAEAPHLLAELTDDQLETYFIRQPETPEDVEAACRAAQVCCVSSLRYGGKDPAIIHRLGNTPEFCDYLEAGRTIVPAPLPWPPLPPTPWQRLVARIRRVWVWIAYGAA